MQKQCQQLAKHPLNGNAYWKSNKLYKRQYHKALRQDGKKQIRRDQ